MEPLHTRAFLLRQVDTGESDRVVTLLTEDLGKVSAIARGARKSRKRFGAALALFVLADAELRRRTTSNLHVLTGYDALEAHAGIGLDIAAIAHGSYATELVAELCPKAQPEPEMFALLHQMYGLLTRERPSSARLRVFEMRLLGVAGLVPQLEQCVSCGRPVRLDGQGRVGFDVGLGGVRCGDCRHGEQDIYPGTYRALQELIGLGLQESESLAVSDEVRRELRATLAHFIRHVVGKPLKSVQFIQKLGHARRE